jgi:hypothetical protein
MYLAWVNIIHEGRIKIEYEAKELHENLNALQLALNATHYPRPLSGDCQDIRLLHVEPGAFDDPIKGYFSLASLKEVEPQAIDFHALSYCWGDPTEREEILLSSSETDLKDGKTENYSASANLPLKPFAVSNEKPRL